MILMIGKAYELLTQDEVYGALLTRFFEAFYHPELAWMHHLATKRYGEAAQSLLAVNAGAGDLVQKQVSRPSHQPGDFAELS